MSDKATSISYDNKMWSYNDLYNIHRFVQHTSICTSFVQRYLVLYKLLLQPEMPVLSWQKEACCQTSWYFISLCCFCFDVAFALPFLLVRFINRFRFFGWGSSGSPISFCDIYLLRVSQMVSTTWTWGYVGTWYGRVTRIASTGLRHHKMDPSFSSYDFKSTNRYFMSYVDIGTFWRKSTNPVLRKNKIRDLWWSYLREWGLILSKYL